MDAPAESQLDAGLPRGHEVPSFYFLASLDWPLPISPSPCPPPPTRADGERRHEHDVLPSKWATPVPPKLLVNRQARSTAEKLDGCKVQAREEEYTASGAAAVEALGWYGWARDNGRALPTRRSAANHDVPVRGAGEGDTAGRGAQ